MKFAWSVVDGKIPNVFDPEAQAFVSEKRERKKSLKRNCSLSVPHKKGPWEGVVNKKFKLTWKFKEEARWRSKETIRRLNRSKQEKVRQDETTGEKKN